MRNFVFVLLAIGLIVISSCQSNEEYKGEVAATLNLSTTENSVWRNNTSRATSATNDIYYVLDANGLCQTAAKVNHGDAASAEKLLDLGSYNVFCITNADESGFPYVASMIGTDFTNQTMVLNTLTDVSLGQKSLSIVASKTRYDINVTVHHILAKLALSIAKVPADISTIKLTLTKGLQDLHPQWQLFRKL